MKKIIVDKNEGVAEVIDRMLGETDNEISIVVPKGSALGRSVSNFHLLKREADSARRNVVVESVDESILAFAKESGIEASHPLWKGVRGPGGFSDIVSRRDAADAPEEKHADTGKRGRKAAAEKEKEEEEEREENTFEDDDEEGTEEEKPRPGTTLRSRFFDATPDLDGNDDDDDDGSGKNGRGRLIGWIIAAVIVIVAAVYIVSAFFNHANITINFTQTPWSYQDSFTADKNAVNIVPSDNTIPAQIFTSDKNITETFKGSSVQQVSQKAQGMITIYNAYSAAPQELVATTRFETPDGLIFRIEKNVVVPGETKNAAGALVPASITVPIVADQAGPSYNIGPVAKLSVPGFANDPGREAGFYGVITASTTNGFIGTRAVPTAADVAAAKASTTAALQAALANGFSGNYPNNFKILDGATMTQVGTIVVNTSTDANGNFTAFGEATLTAIGFDESALKDYLLSLAQTQEQSSTFKSLTLDYSDVTASFAKGQVNFSLSAQGSLEPAFDAAAFAASIKGEGVGAARSAISALPQLSNGEISLWPSWLWNIPSDPNKIHITVN